MLNGNLLKQNLPTEVINAVSNRDVSARRICQKPLLALNLVNFVAPVTCARVSSILGSGWYFLRTFWFKCVKSTQILTDSKGFSTTTIPAHHGDGSSTGEMMPVVCILSSSSSTFLRNGIGTQWAVCNAYGVAPCLSLITYSFPSVPRPLKRFGNDCLIDLSDRKTACSP